MVVRSSTLWMSCFLPHNPSDIPEDQLHQKINALAPEISERWKQMMPDEKIEATQDAVQELEEAQAMKKLSKHNAGLSSFHDTRMTLESLDKEVTINVVMKL
jgi:wobble nucleotide-excising tRNase